MKKNKDAASSPVEIRVETAEYEKKELNPDVAAEICCTGCSDN